MCHRRVPRGSSCRDHPTERSTVATSTPALPPEDIPGFSLDELRGRGGFADVFAGVSQDGTPVAVKVMRRPSERRVRREIEIMNRLGAGIAPRVLDAGLLADGRSWIAMEDLGTDCLATRMSDRARPGTADVLAELTEIAAAVDALHAAGYVHRDLKPENLFFRPDGRVVLIDYGLARAVDEVEKGELTDPSLTRTGERMGTMCYMAPEQWEDARSAGPPADVYALGVMAFELLTGRPPFVGDAATLHHRHATERCPPASSLAPLGRMVDAVLERALAKLPGERQSSASAMIAELAAALTSAPTRATTPEIEVVGEVARTALVALFSDAAAPGVAALAEREGGTVVGVDDGLYVVVMAAGSTAAGSRAGDRLARAAVRAGLARRAVVHADVLSLRTGRRGRMIAAGRALREVGTWASADGPEIEHTDAVRDHLSSRGTTGANQASPFAPIDPEAIPMLGRDRELAETLAAIRAANGPILVTIVGEPGMGKTRFLGALARELRARMDRVHYLKPDSSAPDALARALLRLGLGDDADDWGDEPATDAMRHAARFAMGLVGEDDPGVAAVLAAPGALRHASARAIAAAIARYARRQPIALLVDDGHLVDHAVLDALELCTMSADTRIGVAIATTASFDQVRPRWATRARAGRLVRLEPLDTSSANDLLSRLLRPARNVPAPVVDRLIELAEGLPGNVVELARSIRDSGSIRGSTSSAGVIVASDELLDVAARPIADRIGRHALRHAAGPFAPLAAACAILGGEFDLGRLRAMQTQLPDDDPLARIDLRAGLERLAQRNIVRTTAAGYAVRSPVLAEGIEHAIDAARRRVLHRAALVGASGAGAVTIEQRARHAAGCGDSAQASEAYVELGERAMRHHRYLAAERYFGRAIDHGAAGSRHREAGLAGRGRARYRLQRLDDAIADLSDARAMAHERGDLATVVGLLLDEATAMDIYCEHGESRRRAEQARQLSRGIDDEELATRTRLAEGRSAQRASEYERAVGLLEEVAASAERLGLYEARVIALLLLGGSLYRLGRLDESEEVHARVIALCRQSGDEFHLAAAHSNRQILRVLQHRMDLALEDVQVALELGRQLGNASLEWNAGQNLAECYLWCGELAKARDLAERCMDVARGLSPADVQASLVTLARTYAALDDPRLPDCLEALRSGESTYAPAAWEEALTEAVCLFTDSATQSSDWTRLIERVEEAVAPDVRLEVLMLAGTWAARCDQEAEYADWLSLATELSRGKAFWARRLDMLRALGRS